MQKPSVTQFEKLSAWLSEHGYERFRLDQIARWIHQHRATGFDEMTDLPKLLRQDLIADWQVLSSSIASVQQTSDNTRKILVTLQDGHQIECVLMEEAGRQTVCVSTQVGCAMGCVFCASGLDGVIRNLESHEIVEQFLLATSLLAAEARITRAVIMGMGEPLANLDNLLTALERVCAEDGMGLGQRNITVSTVGLPAPIRRLAKSGKQFHLAISLHAADDELRNQLVPPNNKIGLSAILEAGDYYHEMTGRQVTYEYVLLRDVNDQPRSASQLVSIFGDRPVHLNLIPYNPVDGLSYRTPRSEQIADFTAILKNAGFSVTVRKTKGRKIAAACGQLRLSRRLRPSSDLERSRHLHELS